jgi:tetratricopeptide (TPR) repeat protein
MVMARWLSVFLTLALSMCNALAFDNGEQLDLSLTNEQCYLELDKTPRAKSMSIFRIMCSEYEVGRLIPDGLEKARELSDRLQCGKPTELAASGVLSGLVIEPCRQKTNGLPYAVIRFEALGRKWIADAPPSVIPSIAVLANLPSLTVAQRNEVIERLPTVWQSKVALLSGTQLHRVRTMLRDARVSNQKGDYEQAELLFRELLTIQTTSMGPESAVVGETLLDLALNISNQGRFEEADALFRRAGPLIALPSSAALRARMKNYRCLDAANRGDFVSALAFARDAVNTWRFGSSFSMTFTPPPACNPPPPCGLNPPLMPPGPPPVVTLKRCFVTTASIRAGIAAGSPSCPRAQAA